MCHKWSDMYDTPYGLCTFTSIVDSNMQLEKLYLAPLYSQCFESKRGQVNKSE